MKPPISGKELIKLLEKQGFIVLRQTGSHVFLEDQKNNIRTTIPVHNNQDIGPGLLLKILSDVRISKEEFIKLRTNKK